MDKNVLKKFAIESRQELMEKVANKINRYFVDEEFNVNQNGEVYVLVNDKHTLRLTKSEYENRQLLVKRIKEITLEQVIEEAAYTWFNRIIAIRYMEIHDYLPLTKENQSLGVRVLSSKDNTPDPEIMKISNLINPDLDIGFNKGYYGTIQDNNKRFEYILILVCKKLGKVIPQVFDGVTDYIDILVPDNLLNESGYITKLLKEVLEDNFKQVEIIGWLYQYYISERKSVVEEKIANGKKMDKNDIPAKTQLFTPEWIVRYMVENSLGYIFYSTDKNIIEQWNYCSFTDIKNKSNNVSLEKIKILDPCCGSGHILVYVFEKLYELYLNRGYNKNDICEAILNNNIYGIDIDERAYQLSILSLLLKSREYDKYIFNKEITLNVHSFTESNRFESDCLKLIESEQLLNDAKYLIEKFFDSKEYGSILKIEKRDYNDLLNYLYGLNKKSLNIIELSWYNEIKNILIPICKMAILLSNKYECVITNPPYLSSGDCSDKLNKYLSKEYKIAKKDLYATFMITDFLKPNGIQAMINQHNWMFLSSYKDLREYIINERTMLNAIHLGTKAFEEISGEKVQSIAFIFQRSIDINYQTKFIKLDNYLTPKLKEEEFRRIIKKDKDENIYKINIQSFKSFDSFSFVYWVGNKVLKIFETEKKIMDFADAKQGMATGDNDKYVRNWFEIDYNDIGFNFNSIEDFHSSKYKYVPYIKSSGITKWWGNYYNVLKFDIANYKLLSNSGNKLPSRQFYFKDNVNWSLISTDKFGARFADFGGVFDVGAHAIYTVNEELLNYMGGFLNTKIFNYFVKCMNPTLNYNSGAVQLIPYKYIDNKEILNDVLLLKELYKKYWDFNEYSWDFQKLHIRFGKGLLLNYIEEFIKSNNDDFIKSKIIEQRINDIYKSEFEIEEEIDAKIYDDDITLKKYTKGEIVKELLSYFVGCIFGRFSLDEDGIIFAGGEFNKNKYKSFEVDIDNIIPLTEDNYFGDDIVSRFKKFIEVVYGKETLYENLDFIAETLGKRNGENSEETIRRYFINNFYNDHVKMYQKRPIYWLFDSGKKNGFKCLIYMHRYNEGLVSKIRLDYLHRMQNTYEKELKEISDKLNNDVDLTSKRELSKKQADISAKLQETNEYDEKIAHIADQKIKINLDDGVVVNYAKFSVKNPKTGKDESILAKIK